MEMMTGQEQAPAAAEPKKASLWEDIVDVFVSPAELYRRQAEAGWVKPWLVLSVILVLLYFAFWAPNRDLAVASTTEMLARSGRTLPAGAEPGGGTIGRVIGAVVGQPIGLLIGVLVSGFLLWVASLVAQGGPRFKQAMMIVAWASFPTILQKVILGVLVIIKTGAGQELSGTRDASTGILRFLDPASLPMPLLTALRRVDIFALWGVILWVVALKAICHYSPGKATAVAVATWLLMALPLMGIGFISQLLMGG